MFEVGQTVWDVRMGSGVITGTKNVGPWPIRVRIDRNGTTQGYTLDGKYQPSDLYRSLYFSEPSVNGATTPPFTRKTKNGEQLVVKFKHTSTGFCVITVKDETPMAVVDQSGVPWPREAYTFHRIGKEIY